MGSAEITPEPKGGGQLNSKSAGSRSGPIIRLSLAWILTMAVLVYASARALALGMLVGRPEWLFVGVLVVGIALVARLTFRLGAEFTTPGARWGIAAGVFLSWLALNAVLVLVFNGNLLATPLVIALFAPAMLWVAWLAWMFAWPLSLTTRLAVLTLLFLVALASSFTLRVEGLTGDAHLNFALRWSKAPTSLEAGETASPAFPVDLTRTSPHDYDQFLGPTRLGVVSDARLERDWNRHPPRPLWRRAVGEGWSAFAVVGDFAVTQEQRGGSECVVCYRVADGAVAWVHADLVHFGSAFGGAGPRATPTIAAGRVYSVGATGILNCLDGANGKAIWSVDILQDNQAENISHGVCGSPLVLDKRVIVCPTGPNGISLAAYDRDTGKRLWRGGRDQASYGSPLLAELAGAKQILLCNAEGVAAHNPDSGEVLWRFAWTNRERTNCSQPLPNVGGPDTVFVSTDYGQGCVMLQVERSTDGEWLPPRKLWDNRLMKTKFTTAVFHRGFLFGLDDGILECLDARDGSKKWKEGRFGHGQVLLAGDLLLIQAEDGEVVLGEASPERWKELGRIAALSGKTWNNLALAGKYLLVRNDREAACYELALAGD
jgi:outer membrane protein assembly factor BamB